MMQEFILPRGKYHKLCRHMTGYIDLCDWCNEGVTPRVTVLQIFL
jgi:hypothetical protein